jgi:hypothetical protein
MCVFARFLSKNITRAYGVNFRALFVHSQTKPRIEHGTHASKPPPKSLQKYGYVEHVINSTNSTDNTRFKLRSSHPG